MAKHNDTSASRPKQKASYLAFCSGVLISALVTSGIWFFFGADLLIARKNSPLAQKTVNCENQSRPYASNSPWNRPIGDNPAISPKSDEYIKHLTANAPTLTSDVDQYTIAVYCADETTPRRTIALAGYYSDYTSGKRKGHGHAPVISGVPLPTEATAPAGSDGQVVIWDTAANVEYGWWQYAPGNTPKATNGYVTGISSTGVFSDGLAGRGGGTTYLAGLVRPEELKSGNVEHALAFAYKYPAKSHVKPATKSDGLGTLNDLPEGSLLQLDPQLTEADLKGLGVTPAGLPIARALQKYGMYTIDNSGSSKVYLESRSTAHWGPEIHREILGKIPWSTFRVIAPPP